MKMRKQMEKINISEILENISDAIICTENHGIIIGFLGAASKIFGFDQEEIKGKKLEFLLINIHYIKNESEFPINGIIGKVKNGNRLEIEIINHTKVSNGNEIWIVRDRTKEQKVEHFLDSYHDTIQDELLKIVKEKSMALEKLTIALVSALENANLLNDTETGNHILKVSDYSGLLADKIGCNLGFVKKIRLYAGLHDVGKVGIPDSLLKKRGKYTAKEIRQMHKHVVIGARMLDNPEIDKMAMNIALYHHEKWDGSGYLGKLKGMSIPLEARIVSIVDMYDALRSERVYKKIYNEEKTLKIIKQLKGKNFDPDILETFLRYSDEFEKIRNKYTQKNGV